MPPSGTEFPKGVYPIPVLVTVNPEVPAPTPVPAMASDPANPTKVPFGTLSKLTALLLAWNTVLPTLSASSACPATSGKPVAVLYRIRPNRR